MRQGRRNVLVEFAATRIDGIGVADDVEVVLVRLRIKLWALHGLYGDDHRDHTVWT